MKTVNTPVDTIEQGRALLDSMRLLALKICHEIGAHTDLSHEAVNGAALALQFADNIKKQPSIMDDPDNLFLAAQYIEDILYTYYYPKFIKDVMRKYDIREVAKVAISAESNKQTMH